MTFLLAMAILAVAVVAALCVPALHPAWFGPPRADVDISVYRDQLLEIDHDRERGLLGEQQADQARAEIERRLLAADNRRRQGTRLRGSRRATMMVLLTVPVIPASAVAIYFLLGTPDLPDMPHAARVTAPVAEGVARPATLTASITALRSRLAASPDDAEAWARLGRHLMAAGQYAGAREALLRSHGLKNDPYVRAEAAEADVAANDSQVGAASLAVFEALHAIDPSEPKSRFYIGLAAAQSGNGKRALQEWIDLIVLSPADAPWLGTVRDQLLRVAAETGTDPATLRPSADVLEHVAIPDPAAEDEDLD